MRDLLRAFTMRLIQNPHYKLLAVVVAVGAWWYVQASDVDEQQVRVPVEWMVPGGLITVEPLPPTALVTLSGPRNALRRVVDNDLVLPVDLGASGARLGDHSLELSPVDVRGLPSTVNALDLRPPTVSFTLDEVDVRRVTVQPVTVGEPKAGWVVTEVRLDPAVVELRGPRISLANLISVDTEPVDVSDLGHDRRFKANLVLPRGVELRGPNTVEFRVKVEPLVEARVFSEVPVYVRGASGWSVKPAVVRVHVEGPAASLRQIRDRDVVAQVYLPDMPTRGTYEVSFTASDGVRAEVTLPADGVRVVSVEPSQVEVIRP